MYRAILVAAFVLCVLNFITYWIGAGEIGGGAAYEEGGHYFVSGLGNMFETPGRITEVSKADFDYVTWHGNSLFITHPLALLTGALLVLDNYRRRQR